jgi:uncharacterized protein YciI
MFIIDVTYKKDLDLVEQHLSAHRDFLDQGYKRNFFIASGPKNPRTGGILISTMRNRIQLEELLKQDPFYIHAIADYKIIEFTPTKYHLNFAKFIEEN